MIYDQSAYTAPIDYLISSYIREFDISKANINILLYKGLISLNQFNYYYNLDRMDRQIKIGLLQRDNPMINNAIKNGFSEIRKLFFEANDIKDHEVLSIKKDAIYLINKIPVQTKFSNIEFVCSNVYTSFYKIKKVEFYYFIDIINQKEYLHVKGISDSVLPLHNEYFLEFLLVLFNSAQTDLIEDTIAIIQTFYTKYINLELDIGFYRNFNNESKYTMKALSQVCQFKADHLPEKDKGMLDISHNASIVQELWKMYSNIYFQTKNKKG